MLLGCNSVNRIFAKKSYFICDLARDRMEIIRLAKGNIYYDRKWACKNISCEAGTDGKLHRG